MTATRRATCVQCGREFDSAGTLAEILVEADDPTPEQLERVRAQAEALARAHGGARGVCSALCAWHRLLSVFWPTN